jgi:lysophospholipid acyltransferase (LPLAT)-like uncharacterized protein
VTVASRLGSYLVRALAMTWRYRLEGRDAFDRLRAANQPMVLALWHGELLPCLWLHRGEGIVVLISTHSDGEIIARIAESLGYRTVRGSSSRGGTRAALELVRAIEEGHDVAFTPDGPRGPRHMFSPGAIAIAQRTAVPIICGRACASRAWRLGSWDRFLIPKPFARISVAYSAPQHPAVPSAADPTAETSRFAEVMASLAGPNESA